VSEVVWWVGVIGFWGSIAAPVVYIMWPRRAGFERREDLEVEVRVQ
jgi:hypothetical protein